MSVWLASAAVALGVCAAFALRPEHKLQLALTVAKWSALLWVGLRAVSVLYGQTSA